MICSSKELFDNQIRKLKLFMSWNGFPTNIRALLINKLTRNNKKNSRFDSCTHENIPKAKIWLRIPYLGKQGENLVRNCVRKIRRYLKDPVDFVVIYNTKKISYFLPNKDKIPNLSKSDVVYEISCPGCGSKYIGKTQRCLETRLNEHGTRINKSVVADHFHNCEHAQHIIGLNNMFDSLSNKTTVSHSTQVKNLVLNNFKILHSCKSYNSNILLLLEALYIKFYCPNLNSGLKASKELSLFN